jgi:hypothetical protein
MQLLSVIEEVHDLMLGFFGELYVLFTRSQSCCETTTNNACNKTDYLSPSSSMCHECHLDSNIYTERCSFISMCGQYRLHVRVVARAAVLSIEQLRCSNLLAIRIQLRPLSCCSEHIITVCACVCMWWPRSWMPRLVIF